MDSAIKQVFISRILEKYGARMENSIREGIVANRYHGEGEMAQSIDHIVQGNDELLSGILGIAMVMHGRWQDINASHKYKLRTENPDTNRKRYNPPVKREGFYTRNVYGHLNGIIYSILYGLTDEVIADIKHELEQAKSLS
jgi:hypothetical protein